MYERGKSEATVDIVRKEERREPQGGAVAVPNIKRDFMSNFGAKLS
jgi:hypothetical protein